MFILLYPRGLKQNPPNPSKGPLLLSTCLWTSHFSVHHPSPVPTSSVSFLRHLSLGHPFPVPLRRSGPHGGGGLVGGESRLDSSPSPFTGSRLPHHLPGGLDSLLRVVEGPRAPVLHLCCGKCPTTRTGNVFRPFFFLLLPVFVSRRGRL